MVHYRLYAGTAPGPKYKNKGWECQDYSGTYTFDDTQIAVLADGHGSGNCFRSEHGSRYAVEAAIKMIWLFRMYEGRSKDAQTLSESGIEALKYAIIKDWKCAVKEDWDRRLDKTGKPGEGEVRFEAVSEKFLERYHSESAETVERYLYTAYGTTLLLAVAIEDQVLLLQIGDGSCVVLRRDGTFCSPIPVDENNYLNVVVSICEEDAESKMRHAILDCDANSPLAPVAIFLSSDGVDDCFPVYENDKHLCSLYSVIVENILEKGFEQTEKELTDELLPALTAKGSHDDISLCYLVTEDMDALREALEASKRYD